VGADAREHVDLFVLFVEQVLQLPNLGLEAAHTLFERLGVAARKGSPAELIAGLALEAYILALGAAGSDAIAADFLS